MKKFFNLLFSTVIIVTLAFLIVGCNNKSGETKNTATPSLNTNTSTPVSTATAVQLTATPSQIITAAPTNEPSFLDTLIFDADYRDGDVTAKSLVTPVYAWYTDVNLTKDTSEAIEGNAYNMIQENETTGKAYNTTYSGIKSALFYDFSGENAAWAGTNISDLISEEMTIEAYICFKSDIVDDSVQMVCGMLQYNFPQDPFNRTGGFAIKRDTDKKITFLCYDEGCTDLNIFTGETNNNVTSSVSVENNVWAHIVGVYGDDGTMKIYLNGVLSGTIQTSGTTIKANMNNENERARVDAYNFFVGSIFQDWTVFNTVGENYADSLIAYVRIYNEAASADVVTSLYTSR